METEEFVGEGMLLEGVEEFKYLGDVINNGGGCMRAVMGRVKTAWVGCCAEEN